MLYSKSMVFPIKRISQYLIPEIQGLVLSKRFKTSSNGLLLKNKLKNTILLKKKHIYKEDNEPLSALLNKIYNKEFYMPTNSELGLANQFFNSADVKLEWCAMKTLDIPGEQLKRSLENHEKFLQRQKQEDINFIKSVKIKNAINDIDSSLTDDLIPKKSFTKHHEKISELPEIAFLGRCNAGKSTLLNNLTTKFTKKDLNKYARSSKKAGFTKTINCFNLGNKLCLVDTPGYGVKSTIEQGDIIMDYLKKRKQLRRCFVLISAEQGFNLFDVQLINFLVKHGIAFEIVFTKIDKLKDIEELQSIISESGILQLPILPQMIFLNSVTNKYCTKRYGIDVLRYVILQSCGFKQGIKPSKVKA